MDIISKFKEEFFKLKIAQNGLKVAVALSGGSDSLALTILLQQILTKADNRLIAITIDHQLRAESSQEALKVKSLLSNYNIEHHIIPWLGPKPSGNLQEKARLVRYQLLTDYCQQNNITYLATGHQQNDQAENFIIRAEHGSGVYGLSGITKLTEFNQIQIIRPLLNFSKDELQTFLKKQNIEWIEDPSNQNERFTRVKVRNFLNKHPEWISKLAKVSDNLARAKDAIEYLLEKSMENVTSINSNEALIDLLAFNKLPQEIRFRMISRVLQTISNNPKPARAERIERLLTKLEMGQAFKATTLSDCLITRKKDQILITKECLKTA